jgi:hypothetical protein
MSSSDRGSRGLTPPLPLYVWLVTVHGRDGVHRKRRLSRRRERSVDGGGRFLVAV